MPSLNRKKPRNAERIDSVSDVPFAPHPAPVRQVDKPGIPGAAIS